MGHFTQPTRRRSIAVPYGRPLTSATSDTRRPSQVRESFDSPRMQPKKLDVIVDTNDHDGSVMVVDWCCAQ